VTGGKEWRGILFNFFFLIFTTGLNLQHNSKNRIMKVHSKKVKCNFSLENVAGYKQKEIINENMTIKDKHFAFTYN
jgi:hypothetical protein